MEGEQVDKIDLISIHALLAESDGKTVGLIGQLAHFYPRSPCGERQFQKLHQVRHMQFLSTLSLRRATRHGRAPATVRQFLSTLSLRRATNGYDGLSQVTVFLSTLSLRRATTRPPCQR